MRVAVYGTLKRGQYNHFILEHSTFLGEGLTGKKFQMQCVGFPVVRPTSFGGHKVRVEIYDVSRATKRRLDSLEGNGRMYQRERRWCWTGGQRVRAWIYLGIGFSERTMRTVQPDGTNYFCWPDREHWITTSGGKQYY